MMTTATISMLVFNQNKRVDWKLALVVDPATDIMAFVGGYLAGVAGGLIGSKWAVKSKPKNLKLIFAAINILAAIFMIINITQ